MAGNSRPDVAARSPHEAWTLCLTAYRVNELVLSGMMRVLLRLARGWLAP